MEEPHSDDVRMTSEGADQEKGWVENRKGNNLAPLLRHVDEEENGLHDDNTQES